MALLSGWLTGLVPLGSSLPPRPLSHFAPLKVALPLQRPWCALHVCSHVQLPERPQLSPAMLTAQTSFPSGLPEAWHCGAAPKTAALSSEESPLGR